MFGRDLLKTFIGEEHKLWYNPRTESIWAGNYLNMYEQEVGWNIKFNNKPEVAPVKAYGSVETYAGQKGVYLKEKYLSKDPACKFSKKYLFPAILTRARIVYNELCDKYGDNFSCLGNFELETILVNHAMDESLPLHVVVTVRDLFLDSQSNFSLERAITFLKRCLHNPEIRQLEHEAVTIVFEKQAVFRSLLNGIPISNDEEILTEYIYLHGDKVHVPTLIKDLDPVVKQIANTCFLLNCSVNIGIARTCASAPEEIMAFAKKLGKNREFMSYCEYLRQRPANKSRNFLRDLVPVASIIARLSHGLDMALGLVEKIDNDGNIHQSPIDYEAALSIGRQLLDINGLTDEKAIEVNNIANTLNLNAPDESNTVLQAYRQVIEEGSRESN